MRVFSYLKCKLRKVRLLQVPYSKVKVFLIKHNSRKNLRKYGYKLLKEITETASNTDLKLFCAFGTLLGLVREGGFIKSDLDIDIGIIEDNNFSWKKFETMLSSLGMKKKRQFMLEGVITEQTYAKWGVGVDFFLFRINNDFMTANIYYKEDKRIYRKEDGLSVMRVNCPILSGIEIKNNAPLPINSEEVLAAFYGPGWKTPDPTYKPQNRFKTESDIEAYRN